jgi:RND family efflux transporter MFP subunit
MTEKHNIKVFLISIVMLTLFLNATVVAEEFEATLSWSKRVELSTSVNGIVQKVFARPGETAAKDEVLIQLNPDAFKADLKYASAKLKNTHEQRKEAKRELDRQLDMYDRAMLSEHDLQLAKNNFTTAQAQYIQAQSALTKAKLNLQHSAIRAPFNAIVINVAAVKGLVVASTVTPPILVVVAEAQRMTARFYTMIDDVNELTVNQGVEINIAGRIYQGKISNIALEPDNLKLGHYAVDVIFDSKNTLLRAGQKVKVKL